MHSGSFPGSAAQPGVLAKTGRSSEGDSHSTEWVNQSVDYFAHSKDGSSPHAWQMLTLPPDEDRRNFAFMFFVRMLFSCLVDADFLDTEAFIEPRKANYRSEYPAVPELSSRFGLNDSHEISRWVLSFGEHAEALEPAGLREELRVEIGEMGGRYE